MFIDNQGNMPRHVRGQEVTSEIALQQCAGGSLWLAGAHAAMDPAEPCRLHVERIRRVSGPLLLREAACDGWRESPGLGLLATSDNRHRESRLQVFLQTGRMELTYALMLIFLQVDMEMTYAVDGYSLPFTHTLTAIPATQSQLVLGASTPFPDFTHPGVLLTADGIESAACSKYEGGGMRLGGVVGC